MNAKYKMMDGKVEMSFKAQYRQANRDRRNGSSSFEHVLSLNPTIPVMDPTNPKRYNTTVGIGGTTHNPVADIELKDYQGIDKWLPGRRDAQDKHLGRTLRAGNHGH